ncbi:mitotic-spindle organizing protein 1-like isoform X1 [Rhipicephalus microplus]|uniref:mitotic-spindle organizing protein 1-like isoform X1 n=1 Tax=Rhipicephalus microplus TaxID=6941 RepID=UPI003F6D5B8F
MAAPGGDEQRAAVIETFEVLLEMSQLLNTGLDAQSLGLCVKLCESGVNPVALACLIKEVRAQTASNVPTSVVMERRRLVRQDYVPESKKKSANDDALSDSAGTSAQASKGTVSVSDPVMVSPNSEECT